MENWDWRVVETIIGLTESKHTNYSFAKSDQDFQIERFYEVVQNYSFYNPKCNWDLQIIHNVFRSFRRFIYIYIYMSFNTEFIRQTYAATFSLGNKTNSQTLFCSVIKTTHQLLFGQRLSIERFFCTVHLNLVDTIYTSKLINAVAIYYPQLYGNDST